MLALARKRAWGQLMPIAYAPIQVFHSSASAWQAQAPAPVPLKKLKDNFNDGTSITYLEELEKRYKNDPASVDRTWASFFRSLGAAWADMRH